MHSMYDMKSMLLAATAVLVMMVVFLFALPGSQLSSHGAFSYGLLLLSVGTVLLAFGDLQRGFAEAEVALAKFMRVMPELLLLHFGVALYTVWRFDREPS